MGPDPKDKLKAVQQSERLRQELFEMHARTKRLLEEMEALLEKSKVLVADSRELTKPKK